MNILLDKGKKMHKKRQKKEQTKKYSAKTINRKKQLYRHIGIFFAICIGMAMFIENRWSILSYMGYPQALIEKAYNYPEAREYVYKYVFYKNKHQDMDVSNEVVKGEIPHFLQWDKRWGYEQYGTSMIGVLGCGPTALSMVYCGLTGDDSMQPYEMARYAEENGYYVAGAGTSWDFMITGAENLGLTVRALGNNKEAIINELACNKPVIGIMTPGDFTVSGHFLVFTGIDTDGKIKILDPNSREKSKKTWDIDLLVSQMATAWAYTYEN